MFSLPVETVLIDIQAVERRLAFKQRDGDAERVILLVAETRRNRLALRVAEASGSFSPLPARSREILRALANGTAPPSGILVL